jgi:hypothetical protein
MLAATRPAVVPALPGLGGSNPRGDVIGFTNACMTGNGEPWTPVSGGVRLDLENLSVALDSPRGAIRIPFAGGFRLRRDSCAIMPFNMDAAGVRLVHSTARPLARLETEGESNNFFFSRDGIPPEFLLDSFRIKSLECLHGAVMETNGHLYVGPGTRRPWSMFRRKPSRPYGRGQLLQWNPEGDRPEGESRNARRFHQGHEPEQRRLRLQGTRARIKGISIRPLRGVFVSAKG